MSLRSKWIDRTKADFDSVIKALELYMTGIDPSWRILRVDIAGSFGRHLRGEDHIFKTPYGGVSGAEERGEPVSEEYLSDIDVVIWITEETNVWLHGNLFMHFEGEIFDSPERHGLKNRGGIMINFGGNTVSSKYANTVTDLPLDEHDLRRTHDIVLHMRKPSQAGIFGFEWSRDKQ